MMPSVELNRLFFGAGGIAQLGERLHGMQEVSGSIPLISTKSLFVLNKCNIIQNSLILRLLISYAELRHRSCDDNSLRTEMRPYSLISSHSKQCAMDRTAAASYALR